VFKLGFLRDLGKFTGKTAGFVVGGAVNVVGEVTGSKFIKEVGAGVKQASEFAGDTLGQAADGAWNTAAGIIQKDDDKIENGLGDIGNSVSRTAKGVYCTAKNTYENGKDIYDGIKYNDDEKIKSGAANIAKTVAVGALAVGVIDIVAGADIGDSAGDDHSLADAGSPEIDANEADSNLEAQADINQSNENPGINHVDPHWRTLSDGREIYVDGDGNPNTQLTAEEGGGWMRTNPDGDPNNNLSS